LKILDLAWLAGLLEGEGSFMLKTKRSYNGTIAISLQMTDKDIVEKCAAILKTKVYGPYNSKQKKKNGEPKKETYLLTVFGTTAASWMMTLYPLMGERRKQKIEELLNHWKTQQSMITGKMALCHSNRIRFCKDMCKSCYMKNYHKEKKLAYIAS